MSKMANLQNALNGTAKSVPKAVSAPPPAKESVPGSSYQAPSRASKKAFTTYLSEDFKKSLRLIQAKRGGTFQDLIAEALNDLFAKYDVPVIRED